MVGFVALELMARLSTLAYGDPESIGIRRT